MAKAGKVIAPSPKPAFTSSEIAGDVLPLLKGDEHPSHESTSGIEGAWVFNRRTTQRHAGFIYTGIPLGNVEPHHQVRHSQCI